MAKVIMLGLQKGGVSKTTTTGILAHLLSEDLTDSAKIEYEKAKVEYKKELNKYEKKSIDFKKENKAPVDPSEVFEKNPKYRNRVLTVDMDSQGNLSELLTEEPSNNFIGKSVFEAIAFKQPEKYIHKVNDNLDILPATNFLSSFSKWIYTNRIPLVDEKVYYEGKLYEQLSFTLDIVRDQYDYILIDTPPALSEQTTNALVASDYVIILYESSKFCYSAIPNFMESVDHVQKNFKPNLKKLGILRTLNDKRRTDANAFNIAIGEDYPDLVFDTIITRKATTGRIALYGFEENKELKEALNQFKEFYNELLIRLKESDSDE